MLTSRVCTCRPSGPVLTHGQEAAVKLDALLNAAATASEYDVGCRHHEPRKLLPSSASNSLDVSGNSLPDDLRHPHHPVRAIKCQLGISWPQLWQSSLLWHYMNGFRVRGTTLCRMDLCSCELCMFAQACINLHFLQQSLQLSSLLVGPRLLHTLLLPQVAVQTRLSTQSATTASASHPISPYTKAFQSTSASIWIPLSCLHTSCPPQPSPPPPVTPTLQPVSQELTEHCAQLQLAGSLIEPTLCSMSLQLRSCRHCPHCCQHQQRAVPYPEMGVAQAPPRHHLCLLLAHSLTTLSRSARSYCQEVWAELAPSAQAVSPAANVGHPACNPAGRAQPSLLCSLSSTKDDVCHA